MRRSKKRAYEKKFSILTMLVLICMIAVGMPMRGYALASGGEQKPETLLLYNKQPSDNTPYNVQNMFPGDSETKNYRVRVSYTDVLSVKFRADVEDGYEKLAEVLKCRIYIQEEEVYDGLMKDVQELTVIVGEEEDGVADIDYRITVYLETAVGNEYMNKALVADFVWWADGEYNEDEDMEAIPDEDIPLGDRPDTGDRFDSALWTALLTVSATVFLLVFTMRRREEKA